MIARIRPGYIVVAAAAFVGGAIMGREFLATRSAPAPKPADVVNSQQPAAASPTREASAETNASSQQLWSSKASAASKKSLEAILADRDSRHRMGNLEAFI